MKTSLFFLIIILFFGCGTNTEIVAPSQETFVIEPINNSSTEYVIKKLAPIQLSIGSLEMENDPFYKSNHYGSFYHDQLSCYVIDIPEGTKAGAQVSKVVLFYIDHVLYKKKYILKSNPITQIKRETKKYRVKSLTKDLKDACADKSNKECADLIIAKNKFQFFWKKDYLSYDLYSWKSEIEEKHILTEERSDFKKALKFAKFQVAINE